MKKQLVLLVQVQVSAAPKEEIKSRSSSQYRNNWDAVFGKKESEVLN